MNSESATSPASAISAAQKVEILAEASPEHAKALNVPARHPLLRVCQTVRGSNDQFVFFNTQMVRTDIYKYRTSMVMGP